MLALDIMNDTLKPSSDKSEIEIIKQPPSSVFFDDWVELELNVRRSSEKQISPKQTAQQHQNEENIELRSELCFYDEDKILKTVDTDCFETIFEPSTVNSYNLAQSPKKVTMRFKVAPGLDASFSYFIHTYTSRQQAYVTEAENYFTSMNSKSFRMISSKLKVEPIEWEDIWYKDEGGRDKCMQVDVGLYDSRNELIQNRRIQIKLTLLYDASDSDTSHAKVVKQDILNVFGSPRHFVDPETAKTTIRFRIEDVSKNHQGQNFVVQIAADTSKGNNDDVASIFTPFVSVRSKRNKRQRTSTKENVSQYGYDTAPPPSPGPAHAMGSYMTMPHMPPNLPNAASAAAGIPATPISSHPSRLQPGIGSVSHDSPTIVEGAEDISSLREAMRGVIRWTEEVINGLYPLQWQVIGYAQYPDGTLDYNRPYHSMPNPNERISKILSMYSDATREQLRVLLGAVENTQINRSGSSGGSDSKRMSVSTESAEYPNVIPEGRSAGVPHHYVPNATPLARQEHNPSMAAGNDPKNILAQHQPDRRHGGVPGSAHHPSMAMPTTDPMNNPIIERDDIQNEIEYVLAVHYKSNMTGSLFGFPAYNERNDLLGFYKESRANVGVGRFVPVTSFTNTDLSPIEVSQATSLLLETMKNNSQAVYALKDWGSISNLLDHVMVYDWSNKGRVGSGWWRRDTE